MELTTILGQPSWTLTCDSVSLAVTRMGGHLGPVSFRLRQRIVQPFSVAPWAEEVVDDSLPPVLRALRGDFLCMPFGGNDTPYQSERHPPHGESANALWQMESLLEVGDAVEMQLSMNPCIRPCRIKKVVRLVRGQQVVYCRHVISGAAGAVSLGHHAMLKFPVSGGRVSASSLIYGQVSPRGVDPPAMGTRSSLKPGSEFDTLSRVELQAGGYADISGYPARDGYEDLVQYYADPREGISWTAVAFPAEGYLWYVLKNPAVLSSTILWLSNGGRDYEPWNGRHTRVMGIEEATSYFHFGLTDSVSPNPHIEKKLATSLCLDPVHPLNINYVMGVVEIPHDFHSVRQAHIYTDQIDWISEGGRCVKASVNTDYLRPC